MYLATIVETPLQYLAYVSRDNSRKVYATTRDIIIFRTLAVSPMSCHLPALHLAIRGTEVAATDISREKAAVGARGTSTVRVIELRELAGNLVDRVSR